MKFVNLTPHAISFKQPDDSRDGLYTLPASGVVARVNSVPGDVIWEEGLYTIPARKPPVYGEVTGLPAEQQEGVAYIVSMFVAQQVRREDVFYPDTGPDCVRDDKGLIVAVRRLIRSV